MTDSPIEKTEVNANPKIIVFGLDESSKPHAAWFTEAEADQAERAAGFMRMKLLKVENDDQRALALQLPQGKVFASGKAFTPFIKMGLYERLSGFEAAYEPAIPIMTGVVDTPADVRTYHLPQNWDDLVIGSLVLTFDGVCGGWHESIIVEKRGDGYFVLRWRDWPEFPDFVRNQASLALLPAELDFEQAVIPA